MFSLLFFVFLVKIDYLCTKLRKVGKIPKLRILVLISG